MNNHPEFDHHGVRRVVLIYAVVAALWILFSDRAVGWLFPTPAGFVLASMLKGWVFIAVTALLLYWMLLRVTQPLHRAQEDHLRAMQLLIAVVDGSQDAIFAKDLQGRYVLVNRAACAFLGKTRGEVLGNPDDAVFPQASADGIKQRDAQVVAEDRVLTTQERIDLPVGERIFLATKGPLKDVEGRCFGIFGVSRDITESLRAEAVLKESEAHFRALVEQVQAGIYIIQHERLCYANPGLARMFGYESGPVLSAAGDLTVLAHPQDRERIQECFRLCVEGPPLEAHFRFTGLRRSGRVIEVEVYGRRVDYHGHAAVIGLMLDVSEREAVQQALAAQAEELLLRNEELERMNQAMVGRELDMIGLKKQINALAIQQGSAPPFSMRMLDTGGDERASGTEAS